MRAENVFEKETRDKWTFSETLEMTTVFPPWTYSVEKQVSVQTFAEKAQRLKKKCRWGCRMDAEVGAGRQTVGLEEDQRGASWTR